MRGLMYKKIHASHLLKPEFPHVCSSLKIFLLEDKRPSFLTLISVLFTLSRRTNCVVCSPIPWEWVGKFPKSHYLSTRWEIACLIWIRQKPLAPMGSEQIALSICALSIILYILGGLRQIKSQLMLLQFLKEIFWSQLKIVDLSHHFQLWAKLWNAASVTGFIATSRSQLLL